MHTNDTGTVNVPMNFTQFEKNNFAAHSRPGALRSLVGTWKNLLARLFGGKAFARGALFHILQGKISYPDGAGKNVLISGQFLLPILGSQRFSGKFSEDKVTGTLSNSDGSISASVVAKKTATNTAVRNYVAIAEEIREVLREKFYNPNELASLPWQRAFAQLDKRFARAQDDAEALMHFKQAMRGLAISHFALVGENFGERLPNASSTPEPAAVSLQFPQPHIAHLTLQHFRDGPEEVDAAFVAIAKSNATSLIIDLRGNPGGNLSSMAVAAHLIDTQMPAGIFVGERWWQQQTTRPSPAQIATLATLDGFSQEAFFQALHENGAFRGQVLPRKPRFLGAVFVLIDQRTASAAEPLAELLLRLDRATLIGEKTAGRMLSSETVRLSSGLSLILPTADYFTAGGKRLEGNGVTPQIAVKSSEAMAKAMQLIAELK